MTKSPVDPGTGFPFLRLAVQANRSAAPDPKFEWFHVVESCKEAGVDALLITGREQPWTEEEVRVTRIGASSHLRLFRTQEVRQEDVCLHFISPEVSLPENLLVADLVRWVHDHAGAVILALKPGESISSSMELARRLGVDALGMSQDSFRGFTEDSWDLCSKVGLSVIAGIDVYPQNEFSKGACCNLVPAWVQNEQDLVNALRSNQLQIVRREESIASGMTPITRHPNLESSYILERHVAGRNTLEDHLGQFPRLTHDLEKTIERIEDEIACVEKLNAELGARLRRAFEGAAVAKVSAEKLLDEISSVSM